MQRLGSFCRLIRFDKRGTGLSDRVKILTLEQRMDDVRAVMDAAGSEKAALFGYSEGGPMSILFSATYPARTTALIIYGSYARRLRAPDHPYGKTPKEWDEFVQRLEREWGGPAAIDIFAPSQADDAKFRQVFANYYRQAASPGTAVDIMRMNGEIDVRPVLPVIRVPTLVLHRTGDRLTEIGQARYLASKIHGARLRELAGDDHSWVSGDSNAIIDEIEGSFLPARATMPNRTGSSPPCCLRTSLARPNGRQPSETAAGANCSSSTIRWCGASSRSSAAARSTPPATVS